MRPFDPDLTPAIAAWEALTDEEQAIQNDAFFDLIESGRTTWGGCLEAVRAGAADDHPHGAVLAWYFSQAMSPLRADHLADAALAASEMRAFERTQWLASDP